MDNIYLLFFYLLQFLTNRINLLTTILLQHASIATNKWSKIKQWKRKSQVRGRRKGKPVHKYIPKRNQGNIFDYDVYDITGMFEDDFIRLYRRVKDSISTPRRR